MSARAQLVVSVARALANGNPLDSRYLFFALGESATIDGTSPTCNFLHQYLGPPRRDWGPDRDAIIRDAATRTVFETREVATVIDDALAMSRLGTGHAEVHARHLLLALLLVAKQRPKSDFAQWFASTVKESPAALYRAYREAIRPTVSPEEIARWDATTWFTDEMPPVEKAAPTSATAPAAAPSDTVLAGYSNDAVDGPDLLGLDDEIDGLAQLLIARETVPPMSIGLFGEWGSGKSFFMRLLEERMARISENCRGKPGAAFCCDVIPIKFNAWHYVDANLWASLASHIFESLKDHLAPPSAGEDRRALVTKQLEGARTAVGETEERRKQAAAKADTATVRVAALRKAAFGVSAWIQVAQLPDIRARLKEATAQLNLQGNAAAVERIAGTFSEMSSLGARAMVIWRAFWSREPWKIAVTLLAIIGLPAAGWELGQIVASESGWKQAAGALAGFLVSAGPVLVDLLGKAKRAAGVFEEISRRVQPIIERANKDAEEITKKGEAARGKAGEELQGAEAAEHAARAEVQALEKQLVELRAGQQLFRFVEGRAGDGEYRGQLGLIARVRRDFEALTTLLDRSATEEADSDPATPRADRIVLFIDDLDRCPEERVVEVLQALHLLLAFPLFVVVVAVDQRWLFQSLRHHYRALHQESAETRSAGTTWESTPQDYLEKIFQIPYTLRPMDGPAFKKLIAALAPAMDAPAPPPPSKPDRVSQSSFGLATPAAITPSVEARTGNMGGAAMTDPAPAGDSAPPPPPALPVNPPALKLHHWEVDFLQKLAPLLWTPRSAKRLVNVYRLVRAFHARGELDAFVGTAESPGHFRAAALLLALQFGFPHDAAAFYQKLASQPAPPDDAWLPILESLDQRSGRGRVMADAIRRIGNLESSIPTAQLRRWAPSVARFSFGGNPDRRIHVEETP